MAACVAAFAAVATQRSAARANIAGATINSRAGIEQNAYLNAEEFWKGVVEEQKAQILALKEALALERHDRVEVETELRRRLTMTERETVQCRLDLDKAAAVIRRLRAPLYADDPDTPDTPTIHPLPPAPGGD
jgi:hypothetical protein